VSQRNFEYVATNHYNNAYIVVVSDTIGGLGFVSCGTGIYFLIYPVSNCTSNANDDVLRSF